MSNDHDILDASDTQDHDSGIRAIYIFAAVPVLYLIAQVIRSAGIMAGWWG